MYASREHGTPPFIVHFIGPDSVDFALPLGPCLSRTGLTFNYFAPIPGSGKVAIVSSLHNGSLHTCFVVGRYVLIEEGKAYDVRLSGNTVSGGRGLAGGGPVIGGGRRLPSPSPIQSPCNNSKKRTGHKPVFASI